MYAIDINGEIKTYSNLPKSWKDIIGGFNYLSDEDVKAYGFYNVVMPEDFNENIHILGDLFFDEDVFTYSYSDRTWSESLSELKEKRINEYKQQLRDKLNQTDWYVVRNAETGDDIPSNVTDIREAYRAEGELIENEINALTTKKNVVLYEHFID
jgi:hypothetical protein